MAAPDAGVQRRRALLIATGHYTDDALAGLRAPAGDVAALAAVLRDPGIGGFEVETLVDQPAHDLRVGIEGFFEDAARNELLLLYVSGHGVLSKARRLYFAASTTKLERLASTAIEDGFVKDLMKSTRARSVVLVLDCCHSGAFTRGTTPRGAELDVHVEQRFQAGDGRVTLTASTELEYAFEEASDISPLGEGSAGSVFTRALIDGLQTGAADTDNDGLVSVDELYDYICERVRSRRLGQTPGMGGDKRGDIVIATNPNGPGLPNELTQAMASPLVHVRLGAVDSLVDFLGVPGMVAAARAGLQALTDDDSKRVSDAATSALQEPGPPHEPPPPPPPPPEPEPEPPRRPEPRGPARRPGARPVELARFRHDDAVLAVAVASDGPLIATVSRDHTARLWTADGRQQACLPHPDWVVAAAPSADGRVLATCARDRRVRVWDVRAGRELAGFAGDEMTWAVALDGDRGRIATGGAAAMVQLWDVATRADAGSLQHDAAVVALAFDAGGTRLATAAQPGVASVWDLAGRSRQARVDASGPVLAVGFAADGQALAAGAGGAATDGAIWDIGTGRRTALAGGRGFRAAAFGAGGRLLVTMAEDVARVWDCASGREITQVRHAPALRAVAFDPAGRVLVTAGRDGSVRVWDGERVWAAR